MNPLRSRCYAFAIFACLAACGAWADEKRDDALIEELLKLPAPPPDWRDDLKQRAAHEETPPPDAPLEALAEFWQHAPDGPAPERRVQTRLLESCEAHPEQLASLLRWFPTDAPDFHDRLKVLHDKLITEPKPRVDSAPLHDWLMFNSRHFREDLISLTRKAFAAADDNGIFRNIQALAALDQAAAHDLLTDMAGSAEAPAHTAALAWLLDPKLVQESDARRANWRAELQKIATDKSARGWARSYAVMGLMRHPWAGQEEWLLGLFRDASMGQMQNGSYSFQPLCSGVSGDPEHYIPKVAALVGGKDRAAHNNAVRCLSEFNLENARADALRPLLPWLSDPKWADCGDEHLPRLRLVQSLDRVDLPESVPGLIWVLNHERDYFLSGAAEALQHYGAKEAGGALKAAIAREPDDNHRRTLIAAAQALGAFSAEEMARAIEAYAAKISTAKGREEAEDAFYERSKKKVDPQVSLGRELSRAPAPGDELTARLMRRCREISSRQPAVAEQLQIIIAAWPGAASTAAIAERLRAGDCTAPWLTAVLTRRSDLAADMGKIDGLHGLARGVQAAVSGEEKQARTVLGGDDLAAKLGLLACARLARVALPLDAVGPMLDSADARLVRAASLYLVSEDSPSARAAVLRRHPGEALVLGARYNFDHDPLTDPPGMLRSLILRADGPREIFALLTSGGWGNDGQRLVLVYADRTVLRCLNDGGRLRERILAPEELEKLRAWLTAHRADDLAPFDQGTVDGLQLEYMRVTRDGGRSVFMNNPPGGNQEFSRVEFGGHAKDPDPRIYGQLVGQFTTLSRAPMDVTYETLRDLPGFRVLHTRERGHASALVFDGGKLLVQTRAEDRTEAWQVLDGQGLRAEKIEPPTLFLRGARIERWPGFDVEDRWIAGPVAGQIAGSYVWPGTRKKDSLSGLWIAPEKGEPELLVRGGFGWPVVTPDGEWVVAAKTGNGNWGGPNGVVRIQVAGHREQPVGLPAADTFYPLAWLPVQEKILLFRARENFNHPGQKPVGPPQPEFHLLDPATGKLTRVTGEFGPFLEGSWSRLQPTANATEVWTTMPPAQNQPPMTTVGRYDTLRFAFKPVLKIPGVTFSSADLWIDESARTVTFLVNGDVLRLSLPQ